MPQRRLLTIVAALYFVEGLPMGLFREVIPVYYRLHGVPLELIGALSWLSLAWSLKVLWSPLVDAYGDAQRWIVGALFAMTAALLLLAGTEATAISLVAWLALATLCIASATQDVAIDAYTIGLVPRGEEGPANGVRITAYRAALVSASALLVLPRWIGWPATFAVAATLFVALAGLVWRSPRVASTRERRSPLDALPAMRRLVVRPRAAGVLAFVLLYRFGDVVMGPMVRPFWVDRGIATDQIALISALGPLATVVGALAGGGFLARFGVASGLFWLGLLALLSNGAYAAVAWFPDTGHPGVFAASLVESFCAGLASVAFLAFLMRICEREHAAVQFAGLSALYALPGALFGGLSGWATQSIGYAGYFAATAALALPAFAWLPSARAWLAEPTLDSAPEGNA